MLGVETTRSARQMCTITGDQNHFPTTAVARHLDLNSAIDKWWINETGELKVVIDDVISR